MPFDAITIAPYMGKDSVEPFLSRQGKHAILLALTSNEGAADFQFQLSADTPLYQHVLRKSQEWKNASRLMYVVGATKADHFSEIRALVPNSFLLVPGVGAQGGSLLEVYKNGANAQVGLLVNSSRSILYASDGKNYPAAALAAATELQQQMAKLLNK
jgi:orotidine-5'-phosphate decarboxylase